jgi:transposase
MMREVSMSPSRPTKRPRKRREFSPEFKAEAVRLATSSDKSITAVARELDITVSSLHHWVAQASADAARNPQGALTTDERAELVRLRRELRAAEEERDFLKKAAAYFAKSQS